MIIDPQITPKNISKLIKLAEATKKRGLVYSIIASSIAVSGVCTYLSYLNTGSFSYLMFISLNLIISCFLLLIVYFCWKAQLGPGLYTLGTFINQICSDDWSCSIWDFKNLPPQILRHPVTRCVIGLYAHKYEREAEGLAIIMKAATELPEINKAIVDGKISDSQELKKLYESLNTENYPAQFTKFYDLISEIFYKFAVLYAFIVILQLGLKLVKMLK